MLTVEEGEGGRQYQTPFLQHMTSVRQGYRQKEILMHFTQMKCSQLQRLSSFFNLTEKILTRGTLNPFCNAGEALMKQKRPM